MCCFVSFTLRKSIVYVSLFLKPCGFFAEGVDYLAVDEEVVFGSDEVSKQVLVPFTEDDIVPESNKTFEVYLSASLGVFISPIAYATATILNDDLFPLQGLCSLYVTYYCMGGSSQYYVVLFTVLYYVALLSSYVYICRLFIHPSVCTMGYTPWCIPYCLWMGSCLKYSVQLKEIS